MKETNIINLFSKKPYSQLGGVVVGLTGELGAGKTTLVKKILKSFTTELELQVSSPSFSLCNYYQSGMYSIHHFDLYRIKEEEELYHIELFETINDQQSMVFIEWANLFPLVSNLCDWLINISLDNKGQRIYDFKKRL